MIRVRMGMGIGIGIGIGIRVVITSSTLGIKRRFATKDKTQRENKINQIGTRVDPIMQIRNRNKARRINMRVRAFDNHVSGRVNIDTRWVTRVRFHEPDNNGDVVGNRLIGHGYGSIGLEEINGAAIVVSEGSGFGFKRRESC